jgi:hypothetical protein
MSTPAGTIVQLREDDGSVCPFFEPVDGDKVNLCYFLPKTEGFREELELIVEDKSSYPNPPHTHAECIKAWADGAEIEFYDDDDGDWCSIPNPRWMRFAKYRVKPQKSQKDIEELEAALEVQKHKVQKLWDEWNVEVEQAGVIYSKLQELKSNA